MAPCACSTEKQTRPSNRSLAGRGQEGIDDSHTVDALLVLQIFCEHVFTIQNLYRSDDQAIPSREAEAILDIPGAVQGFAVNRPA